MRITNEIQRAVKYLNANSPISDKIDDAQMESYITQAVVDFESGNYDFSTYDSIVLKQSVKRRHVKMYKPFSTENILCQIIKQILDKRFKVKYPIPDKLEKTLYRIARSML